MESTTRPIVCGVPQGSVLGPLLFLLYINDLPSCSEFFTLLFADDTTFQLSGANSQELFTQANEELKKAATWFQANKLTLNTSKTKFMVFRRSNCDIDLTTLSLEVGSEEIERIGEGCRETAFKFVGHFIDDKLKWNHHIKHLRCKLSRSNYIIAKSKNFLPQKIRTTLYHSLFRSHLEYGIVSWGGALPSNLKCLVNLQKKCIRNVAGKRARDHTDPIFSKLEVLKLNDLYKVNLLTFMHKYYYNKQPVGFSNFFNLCPAREILPNRQTNYKIEKSKNNTIENLPIVQLPLTWNREKLQTKLIHGFSKFKTTIMKDIIGNYSPQIQ